MDSLVDPARIPQRILSVPDDVQDYILKRRTKPLQGEPIMITGSPRSGTTMLAELFNNGQLVYYHEPFIRKSSFWSMHPDSFKDGAPADMAHVQHIWSEMLSQRAWSHYRKTDSKYPYITKGAMHRLFGFPKRRIVVKDPSLSYWMDMFMRISGPVKPVFLFRDPRAIVSSLLRLNWDPGERLAHVFNQTLFKHFALAFAQERRSGLMSLSPLQRMSIQTAILHASMRRQIAHIPKAAVVHFEHLVREPAAQLSALSQEIDLPSDFFDPRRTKAILAAKHQVYNRHQYQRDATAHVHIWDSNMSKKDIQVTMELYHRVNPPYSHSTHEV